MVNIFIGECPPKTVRDVSCTLTQVLTVGTSYIWQSLFNTGRLNPLGLLKPFSAVALPWQNQFTIKEKKKERTAL